MLTVAGVNVEKEAGERIDSPASDAFSVLYPIPLDKLEVVSMIHYGKRAAFTNALVVLR